MASMFSKKRVTFPSRLVQNHYASLGLGICWRAWTECPPPRSETRQYCECLTYLWFCQVVGNLIKDSQPVTTWQKRLLILTISPESTLLPPKPSFLIPSINLQHGRTTQPLAKRQCLPHQKWAVRPRLPREDRKGGRENEGSRRGSRGRLRDLVQDTGKTRPSSRPPVLCCHPQVLTFPGEGL